MSLTIKHPEPGFTGSHSGLDFTDGAAEIEAPTEAWTHEQIDEFAVKFEIDLSGASKKDEKLALIAKAIEERTQAAEATGVLQ